MTHFLESDENFADKGSPEKGLPNEIITICVNYFFYLLAIYTKKLYSRGYLNFLEDTWFPRYGGQRGSKGVTNGVFLDFPEKPS